MNPTYIIAEAGVNHNGSAKLACQLIDAAKAAGADAVKFQTFKTEKILTRDTIKSDYQKINTGTNSTQYEMVKSLELSYDDFIMLNEYAKFKEIDFLSTPDDEDSLDFLVDEIQLRWIKIGSSEVTNLPFLRQIGAKQRPLILSTGMSTLGEVERAVRAIRETNEQELVLLHCTTNYPCPSHEVNLRAMQTMKSAFNTRVGYSDHTLGTEVAVAAVALGAEIIEKHITLDRSLGGPDHRASLDPDEFKIMVAQIRAIESALGDGVKWPNPSEEIIKQTVRRRIVAASNLKAGTYIEMKHLCFKRANAGLFADQFEAVIGRQLIEALEPDMPVEWIMLGGFE